MRPHIVKFFAILFTSLFLSYISSCSKDDDFVDMVIDKSAAPVKTPDKKDDLDEDTEPPEDEPPVVEQDTTIADSVEITYVEHTSSFTVEQDAHIQDGIGYNLTLVRIDGNRRTSYLMFDLSGIDSVGGLISGAKLKLTVNTDPGDGDISIYKGSSTDWSETSIDDSTAPDYGVLLGSITDNYKIGANIEIALDTAHLQPEKLTLVLIHEGGSDLAFASKEHPDQIGPELSIRYTASEDAPSLPGNTNIPDDGSSSPEDTESPIPGEGPDSGEDSTSTPVSEENSNELPKEEVPTPGASSGEEEPTEEIPSDSNQSPVARASANPLKGPVPLEVGFKGEDSTDDNSVVSYAWNFKDGGGSTSANPTHTFDKAGTYDVVLTVKDEAGLSDTSEVTIIAEEDDNKAPVAKITASPTSGIAPLEVNFTGSNSSDDHVITSYSWNFKDGGGSTSTNPKHTFDSAGIYEVELTVKDEAGLSDKSTVTITVNQPANEAPKAVAGANVQVGDAPLEVFFTSQGSSDDQGIVSYLWDFDNGDTASGQNPNRIFNIPGIYEVSLTVIDGSGLTDSHTITITVNQDSSGGGNAGVDYPSGAILASSFGYNSSNATSALEDAIRSSHQVIVVDKQSNDWIIEPSKYFDINNKTIIIQSGVVIRARSGSFSGTNDRLIEFVNANNVTIEGYGATLAMNKNEYNSGEGRHALSLQGVQNMTIKGLTIKDSGGDGIYLSRSSARSYCENITIEDIKSLNNRRNGMTINSAVDVWVRNSEFSSNKGTQPEAGVDLEPNNADERLVNINFSNCKFFDNNYAGFKVAVAELNGGSTPISIKVINSEFGFNARSTSHSKPRTEIFLAADHTNPVRGDVLFESVQFNGSQVGVLYSQKTAKAFTTIFRNCIAKDMLQSLSVPLISLAATSSSTSLGGYIFDNFQVEYGRNEPFLRINGPSNTILEDITGDFTVKSSYKGPVEYNNGVDPSKGYNVNIDYKHIN